MQKEKMRRTQGTELASLTMLRHMNERLDCTVNDSFDGLNTIGSTNSLFPRKMSPPHARHCLHPSRAVTSDLPEIYHK